MYEKTKKAKEEEIEKLDRKQSSRQLRRTRTMGDIENGIHDSLVATAEPEEEAKRRCGQRILGVLVLLHGAVAAVELFFSLYIGIKDSNMALLAIAVVLVIFVFVVGYPFYLRRHLLWKSVCEICNPEEELHVDG